MLVRTVLKENNFNHSGVQQSDYAFEWENGAPASERADEPSRRGGIARFLKRFPFLHKVVASVYHVYRPANSMLQLSLHNPHLEELPVASLTRGATD